jgi:hypothetical protein
MRRIDSSFANDGPQRMVTGIVDRYLEINEKFRKRREEYLWSRGPLFPSNGHRLDTNMSDSVTLLKDIASFTNFGTSSGTNTTTSNDHTEQTHERFALKGNDFSISAALKKGIMCLQDGDVWRVWCAGDRIDSVL